MRDCNVTLSGNSAEVSQVTEYINEHSATRLLISLNDELKASEISYYTLCFKPGAALKNPPNIKVTTDMLVAENGTIAYPLPQALTQFGSLDAQVQAYITDENNALVSLIKSPVFRLNFEPSITGEEDFIITDANGFIAELHKALEELNLTVDAAEELCDKINEAYENGEFKGDKGENGDKGDTGPKGDKGEKGEKGADALINGYNAVTLKSGNNIRLTQQGNEITLDLERIPVCFDLPENAEYGDVCLYAKPGIITKKQSGKYVAVDWDGLRNAIAPNTVLEIIIYKDGEQAGYICATFGSADETTVYEQVIMFEFTDEKWYITLNESGIDSKNSYHEKDGEKKHLTELPKIFRLPEFDRIESTVENVKDTILCTSLVPMYYCGKWQKFENESCIPAVHTLPTDAADGDMCLYSPMNIMESGKRIYFDWEEFAKPVDGYYYEIGGQAQYYDDSSYEANGGNAPFDFDSARGAGSAFFQININTPGYSESYNVSFDENGSLMEGLYSKQNSDGTFEETYYTNIDELPRYIDVPVYDYFPEGWNQEAPVPFFYAPYRLMFYRAGEWQSIETLLNIPQGVTQTEMQEYVAAAINGSLDEVETMIDESGVLE